MQTCSISNKISDVLNVITSRALWLAPKFIEVDDLPKKTFFRISRKIKACTICFLQFSSNFNWIKKYAVLTFANKGQHLLFFDQKVSCLNLG